MTARRPDHIRLSALVRSQSTQFTQAPSLAARRWPPETRSFFCHFGGFFFLSATTICSRAVAVIFSHTLDRAYSLGSFRNGWHLCDHDATGPVLSEKKLLTVTLQRLPTGLSPHEVSSTVGATGKTQLMVRADVTTCCSKLKTSHRYAVISKGNCRTISKRVAFPSIRGYCFTFLVSACSCSKTLRIM